MKKRVSWFSNKPSVAFAFSMLAVCILPLICGWVFYTMSSNEMQKQQENLVEQSLQMTMHQFDADLQDVTNLAIYLRKPMRALDMPEEQALTNAQRFAIFEARKLLSDSVKSANAIVNDVYVVGTAAEYGVSPMALMAPSTIHTRYWKPYGISEADMHSLHRQNASGSIYSPNQTRPVYLLTLSKDASGFFAEKQLVIVLSEHYFGNLMSGFVLPDVAYCLYDSQNVPIYSQNMLQSEEDTTVFTLSSAAGQYTLKAFVPNAYFYNHASMLRILYLSLLGATLILSALLIFSLTRRTVMPINKIISYIKDHYDVQDDGSNHAGLYMIQSSVEKMLQEHNMHQRKLEAYQEQEEMRALAGALLGQNTEMKLPVEADKPYAVAFFPLHGEQDPEKIRAAIDRYVDHKQFVCRIVFLSGDVFTILRKVNGCITEDECAHLLETLLQHMDDDGLQGLCCTMSTVHESSSELEKAYREVLMASESLRYKAEIPPVMRYDTIHYSPEYFLRDYHHLDKQLTFASQLDSQDFELALATLNTLFPSEFMDDTSSTLSQLHLSSLKFQFVHDMNNHSVPSSDADELNHIHVRDILSCTSHRELLSLMHRIISDLSSMPKAQGEEHDMQIDEIKTYIRNNSWDRQLSVAAVADAFSLSSNALSKLFSRKANMGVLQYIHKIRIENACNLLLQDEDSNIADIAMQVGYASTLTFNRAFKARYNMTPSEYRRLHHKSEGGNS